MSWRQDEIYSAGIVFLGVLSDTKPTRNHQPPSSIMISYFLVSIIDIFRYKYYTILNIIYQRPYHLINQSSFCEMKFNQSTPLTPQQKAKKLGFTSQRFAQDQMSQNARKAIQYVKKKDRSDINLNQWRNNKFYKTDVTLQLFKCSENIPRVHKNQLPLQDFIQKFEKPNLPVVIQGCTETWNTESFWKFQYFYQEFKQVKFKIGQDDDGYKLRIPLKYYFQYLVYNKDDSPLYMFQSSLESNKEMLPILNNYTVPEYFQDDLLKYAGEKKRPPYRWLLMGPQRSGSTVHIDPLNTSAWNCSLEGHKRWVLFPERVPKFIVKGKAFRGKNYQDESINYFTSILPKIIQSEGKQRLGIIQFIQKPGQTVFVPGGWWHAVLNLDDTMAVTQNVMTHINFDKVWRSIRCERRKFAHKYLEDLKKNEYNLFERAIQLNKKDNYQMGSKYERQSVSLSFTGTQSSSSSSSSSSSQSLSAPQKHDNEDQKEKKSRRSRSQNSRQFSRSREKKKQDRTKSLKNKKRKLST